MPARDRRIETGLGNLPDADTMRPDSGAGASCTFVGITRPETHPEFGSLEALEYEAAGQLARAGLQALANEVAERHDLRSVRMHHALGRVPVGSPSVVIETTAAHRDAAFAACREAIDRLKREVPIWKRECWRHGSTWSTSATPIDADASVGEAS